MPIGTQGNVIALIDSQNSLLASWYLTHRGCKSIFLSTTEIEKEEIETFLKNWFIKSKIIEISTKENLYEQINKVAFENNCEAIITGGTLFNDSKISIERIKEQKKQLDLPILHPLVAMDKKEINTKSIEIGLLI